MRTRSLATAVVLATLLAAGAPAHGSAAAVPDAPAAATASAAPTADVIRSTTSFEGAGYRITGVPTSPLVHETDIFSFTTQTFSTIGIGAVQRVERATGSSWVTIAERTIPAGVAATTPHAMTVSTSQFRASDAGPHRIALYATVNGVTQSTPALVAPYEVTVALRAPTVDTHPASTSATAGQTVEFRTVATDPLPASGARLLVQWQRSTSATGAWSNIPGATSSTYSVQASTDVSGHRFRAVHQRVGTAAPSHAYSSEVESNPATLTVTAAVTPAPTIAEHPASLEVTAGETASFSVRAQGTGTLSYRWQQQVPGGQWTDLSGQTASSLTTGQTSTAMSGYRYRVVVGNTVGGSTTTRTSDEAALTVLAAERPRITEDPTDQVTRVNGTATFTVQASGSGPLTYHWEVLNPGSTSWSGLSPTAQPRLMITPSSAEAHGRQYRVTVSNAAGSSDPSRVATLRIGTVPTITQQPADAPVAAGTTATFEVRASGDPAPTIQWQWSGDGGTTWHDSTEESATSQTFTTAVRDASHDGFLYRALVQNRTLVEPLTSREAVLRIEGEVPLVTADPVSTTVRSGTGDVSLTVGYRGAPEPTIQWQDSTDGTTWSSVTEASGTTRTLTLTRPDLDLDGRQYRAVLRNEHTPPDEPVLSGAATLTVLPQTPEFGVEPASRAVDLGDDVEFAVTVANTTHAGDPAVHWEHSDDGDTWTRIDGATTLTLTVPAVSSDLTGRQYRAVLTNALDETTASQPATLTVLTAPEVITQPDDARVRAGDTANFTVEAGGRPAPDIQWQWRMPDHSTWSDATSDTATSADYTSSERNTAQNGMLFRARLTNQGADGTTHTTLTREATLTVDPQVPEFATHPTGTAVPAGTDARFTATIANRTAAGDPRVHWEHSDDGDTWTTIDGATTLTLTVPAVPTELTGRQYRAVLTNSIEEATASEPGTLTVQQAPRITLDPTSRTVQDGTTVELTADADGNPTPTVQWHSAPPGTTDWTEIPLATDRTLTLTATDELHDRQYKAVFTNGIGDPAHTQPATLTVLTAPEVITQPDDARVRAGDTANFTVEAGGRPAPDIQWQWSADGTTWYLPVDNPTANDPEFVTDIRGNNHDGFHYRAALTNQRANGTTQTTHTRAALLTVDPQVPRFHADPVDAEVVAGTDARFTVTIANPVGAGGDGLRVHWEHSDDGDTWTVVDDASGTTLTVPAVTSDLTGRLYRAVLTNTLDEAATSQPAALTVLPRVQFRVTLTPRVVLVDRLPTSEDTP